MKRFLSVILAVIMCCSILSVGVLAESDVVERCADNADSVNHEMHEYENMDEIFVVDIPTAEDLISAVEESVEETAAEEHADTLLYDDCVVHTPGEWFVEANYSECSGGWKIDRYECTVCWDWCDAEGNSVDMDNPDHYEDGTGVHTPGKYIEPDYTECGGGYKEGYYYCSVCEDECDADGNSMYWSDREWFEGTGIHTPGEFVEPSYTECGGGYKEGYYRCSVCDDMCDAEGNTIYWDEREWFEGTAAHTPGKYYEPEYTECSGGYIEGYYYCSVCDEMCDAEGNSMDWSDREYVEGTGIHTPGDFYEADYVECDGGWTTDHYRCADCWTRCDADGKELNREDHYKEGNGKHTVGQKYEADYTVCGGGWTVDYYDCEDCYTTCDAEGNELSWKYYEEGTELHTPGTVRKATYTECGGGWIIDRYECTVCGWYCDENGEEPDYDEYYKEGNGKHTSGRIYKADYTECGGGWTVDYSFCKVCDSICSTENGELNEDFYKSGNGKHTPGRRGATYYTECGGGITAEYYYCKDCGYACDAEGKRFDREKNYVEGNGEHTPGEFCEADYTECSGGWTIGFYLCKDCHWECDAEGNTLDLEEYYKEGNGDHTPGAKLYEADYTECYGGFTEPYYHCSVCGMPCDKDGENAHRFYEEGYGHEYVDGACTHCDALLGDMDESGKVDALDLVRLMRQIANYIDEMYYIYRDMSDINQDGNVDILDVIRLARMVA